MQPTRPPLPGLVAIATSAGGIAALQTLLHRLPPRLPAAVAIVQHRTARLPDLLDAVLTQPSALPVKHVEDGEAPRAGVVYLAPPDRHLTVGADRRFHLVDGTRVHHVLSSADPLFATAAAAYGDRLVAVVLTGGDHDATDGVQTVAAAGGVVIAEDPETAHAPGMPRSAIATGAVSFVLPLEEIAPQLELLTRAWGAQAPESTPARSA